MVGETYGRYICFLNSSHRYLISTDHSFTDNIHTIRYKTPLIIIGNTFPSSYPKKNQLLVISIAAPFSLSKPTLLYSYHPNPSSKRSTCLSPCLFLTASRTSSPNPPGPHTPTPIAPICSLHSISTNLSTFGFPGNICTVALGLWISLLFRGLVTNN